MAIGAIGTQPLFSYQTALSGLGAANPAPTSADTQSGVQSSAIAEALTSAYSTLASAPSGFLGASGVLPSLASGLYDLSAASGGTPPSISGLTSAFATSGLGIPTASLFSSGKTATGSAGLLAAVNLDATMALAAYSYRASTNPQGASSPAAGTVAAQPTTVQSAIQAALAATTSSTLSLFG